MPNSEEQIVEEVVYVDSNGATASPNPTLQEQLNAAQKEKMREIEELALRYPSLVAMSGALKFVGIVFCILYVIVAIIQLIIAETWGEKILYFFICLAFAVFFTILFYFLAEYIEVQLSIERSLRRMNTSKK